MTCLDSTECYHLVCMIGISLYRRVSRKSGSSLPGYYCSFRIPTGGGKMKQIHRQTGKTLKREAEEAAAALRSAMLNEAGAGEERSARIHTLLREAGDLAIKGNLSGDAAREFLSKMVEAGSGEKLQDHSIGEWLDIWLAEKKTTSKPATYSRYQNAAKRFKMYLGGRVANRLETIAMKDIQGFRDQLHGEGRSAKTSNGYLKDIRGCLKLAVKEGLLTRSPASSVGVLSEDDSITREPFAPEEVQKLLAASISEDWRGVIILGAYAGLRLGDAATLKAGNVDFGERCIRYMPQKTSRKKKIVLVPMHECVEAFFLNHPLSDDPSAALFPELAKMCSGGRNGLSLTFGRLMESAGITRTAAKDRGDGAGRTQYSRSFHSLRHSFNSWMANADVSQEVRMQLTGHSTKEVNDIYTHTGLQALRAAIAAIPRT